MKSHPARGEQVKKKPKTAVNRTRMVDSSKVIQESAKGSSWKEDLSLMFLDKKRVGKEMEPDKRAHTIALAMKFRKPRESLMKKITEV